MSRQSEIVDVSSSRAVEVSLPPEAPGLAGRGFSRSCRPRRATHTSSAAAHGPRAVVGILSHARRRSTPMPSRVDAVMAQPPKPNRKKSPRKPKLGATKPSPPASAPAVEDAPAREPQDVDNGE